VVHLKEETTMLFFELFPAFMAVVALAAGVWLFLRDRQAKNEFAEGRADRERL
jgi:hypothetical protein